MSDTLYIGGTWRPASDGRTFDVENPADESALASVADATGADAADAIAAAAKAQDEWGQSTTGQRTAVLRELHAALAEARGEVAYGAQFLTWYADQATQTLHGEHYTDPSGSIRILTSRRPVGPALLITPWNFPLAMITRKLARARRGLHHRDQARRADPADRHPSRRAAHRPRRSRRSG